jgi:hypothetical protein
MLRDQLSQDHILRTETVGEGGWGIVTLHHIQQGTDLGNFLIKTHTLE